MKKPPKEYALIRLDNAADGSAAWIVNLKRRGRLINRYFADTYFGGPDAALKAARFYRDTVAKAFPPFTTRESAQHIRSNNQSGVSGVVRCHKLGQHIGWAAIIQDGDKRRSRYFGFSKYGEDAFEQAVECRLKWVASKQAHFHTRSRQANAVADTHFAELLELEHVDDRTLEGFTTKLKMIDAEFFANFPRLVYVSVNIVTGAGNEPLRMRGLVYASGFTKNFEPVTSLTNRSLADGLVLMKTKIETILQSQCGPRTAQAFIEEHGALFMEREFDRNKGLSVRTRIAN